MIHAQNTEAYKLFEIVAVPSGGTGAGTAVSNTIDTHEADYAQFQIQFGTPAATDSNLAIVKIQEADTTDDTAFVDVTGTVGEDDGTGEWLTPAPDTEGTDLVTLNLNCLPPRKRYLRVYVSVDKARDVSGVAILSRLKQTGGSGDATVVNVV